MRLPAVGSLQLRLALSLAAVYLAATAIAIVVLLYQAYSTADALSKEDLNRRARHLASLASADASGAPRFDLPDWLDALYRSGTFLYAVTRPDGPIIAASTPDAGDLVSRLPVPRDAPVGSGASARWDATTSASRSASTAAWGRCASPSRARPTTTFWCARCCGNSSSISPGSFR
jgi:hypothetical protein